MACFFSLLPLFHWTALLSRSGPNQVFNSSFPRRMARVGSPASPRQALLRGRGTLCQSDSDRPVLGSLELPHPSLRPEGRLQACMTDCAVLFSPATHGPLPVA